MIDDYPLYEEAGHRCLNNKMNYCKSLYIKALDFFIFSEYLKNICSNFNKLDDIFGARKNIGSPKIVDSFESNLEVSKGYENVADIEQ